MHIDSKLGKLFSQKSTENFPSFGDWHSQFEEKLKLQIWVWKIEFSSKLVPIQLLEHLLVLYRPELTSNCYETFCGSFSCAPDWKKILKNKRKEKSVKKKKKEQEHTRRTHSKLNCSIPLPLSMLPSFVHILLQWFGFILGISLGQQLGKCFGHLFNLAICF